MSKFFAKGSYAYLNGDYVINGYFIPRNGGIHQGVTAIFHPH